MARFLGTYLTPLTLAIWIMVGELGSNAIAEPWRPGMDSAEGTWKSIPMPSPAAVAGDPACASVAGIESVPWQCFQGVFHVIAHYYDESGVGRPETPHWRD